MTDTGIPIRAAAVLDGRGLRALAHPIRVRLLGQLRMRGPSTATRLGEALGLASGATSYHLRQLAEAGLVEEDAERGNRRDRWWRAAHPVTTFDADALWDTDPEAAVAYLQSVAALYTERIQRHIAQADTRPPQWRGVGGLNDALLRLTPAEAEELTQRITALLDEYRSDDPERRGEAPDGAERVVVQYHVMAEADPEEGP